MAYRRRRGRVRYSRRGRSRRRGRSKLRGIRAGIRM